MRCDRQTLTSSLIVAPLPVSILGRGVFRCRPQPRNTFAPLAVEAPITQLSPLVTNHPEDAGNRLPNYKGMHLNPRRSLRFLGDNTVNRVGVAQIGPVAVYLTVLIFKQTASDQF